MQASKAQDEALYALAKLKLSQMRSQGASAGVQQIQQQAAQSGGAPMAGGK
jgi:sulfur transfer protein SufE